MEAVRFGDRNVVGNEAMAAASFLSGAKLHLLLAGAGVGVATATTETSRAVARS